MNDWNGITEKQKLAISLIEKNLPGIKFVGSTKRDAMDFIGQYMEESMAKQKRRSDIRYRMPVDVIKSSVSNEEALLSFGRHMNSFYGIKDLSLPDMTVAYISEDHE